MFIEVCTYINGALVYASKSVYSIKEVKHNNFTTRSQKCHINRLLDLLYFMMQQNRLSSPVPELLYNKAFHPFSRLEPISAVIRREAGYTLDRSPVHQRVTQRQTTTHANTHS